MYLCACQVGICIWIRTPICAQAHRKFMFPESVQGMLFFSEGMTMEAGLSS